MIRRKSAGHAAVILVAATLLGGCQASAESPSATTATSNGSSPAAASTGVEPSPQASAEAASDSVGPSAAASAAASDSVGPSPAASAAAATLTIKKISTKRWGDAPFKATAAASDGAPVRFGGSGGCTVDPLSGRVTIKAGRDLHGHRHGQGGRQDPGSLCHIHDRACPAGHQVRCPGDALQEQPAFRSQRDLGAGDQARVQRASRARPEHRTTRTAP